MRRLSRRLSDRRGAAAVALLVIVVGLLGWALITMATAGRPMSLVDEFAHLDTAYSVHRGGYPHRGSVYGDEVIQEWACGVGHEAGSMGVACGDPSLGPDVLPVGRHTSGYIHYPTFFVAAEAYRDALSILGIDATPLSAYRTFASLVMVLGIAACAVAAWAQSYRGSALLAGALLPSATSGILLYGTTFNPSAGAILAGALIGWAGLNWCRTGRGFGWLAGATGAAALLSVTASLPAGVFLLASTAAILLRYAGWELPGSWRPRWLHVGILTGVLVLPVLGYGWWIEDHATISNEVLYAGVATATPEGMAIGAVFEFFNLHSPWFEGNVLFADGPWWTVAMRHAASGMAVLTTIVIFGTLALRALSPQVAAALTGRTAAPAEAPAETRTIDPIRLVAGCALAGIALYPPALRLSNALNFGFDFGIVSRYSIAFSPLLIWLALDAVPDRRFARLLAVIALIAMVGISAAAL